MALPRRHRVERDWPGCTAVIVCSGPSLSVRQLRTIARARNFPDSKIRVIAVNDAVYGAWWSDWLHACDWGWWMEHIQHVHMFPGIKTTLAEDVPAQWVTGYLKNTGADGFDTDPSCCRTGGNSGYQAMCIAAHAGASKIVLVGMDMRPAENGETHFFGEHRDGRKANFNQTMLPHFDALKRELDALGIMVINATPGSALQTFPVLSLEEALR